MVNPAPTVKRVLKQNPIVTICTCRLPAHGHTERSFSGSGDIGFQVFTGVDYALDDNWSAQAEIRYLNVSGIDMKAEENVLVGSFQNIDYTPLSVQLNLIYTF